VKVRSLITCCIAIEFVVSNLEVNDTSANLTALRALPTPYVRTGSAQPLHS
jgi:hypothetical protein